MPGVIVLAGGRGQRMGGVDKASVRLAGERLIDRLLRQLPYGAPVAVVSPYRLGMPQVCESPLFGGPAAGIAAGHAALVSSSEPTTAIFAVDAPDSPRILPVLEQALESSDADAAVATLDGRLQPLCALWRTKALTRALEELGDPRNKPAMHLLRLAGTIAEVEATPAVRDIDTMDELRIRRERLATQR
ncbi:molybdenum cofactor guanylyltransferase [Corynebacterium hesseae]